MKKQMLLSALAIGIVATSCVSKKKYTELENELNDTRSVLMKTRVDKEDCEARYAQVEDRVSNYYAKINALQDENDDKLEIVENMAAMSENNKRAMRRTLTKVDPEKLAGAKTLGDSIDLAISHNLTQSLGDNDEDISINVNNTVVQITISDKLLFRSGSYRVNPRAHELLERIANVVKSEPAIEVLVEGHTDAQTVIEGSHIQDNWDLSVRRSLSIVRLLEDKFDVEGKQLIASGRSSFMPLADNTSAEGRSKNRRTRILILPNLDKFLALLES